MCDSCVEQTFGIMKKMWIVMTVPTESSKESKVRDVWACCILHNLMRTRYPVLHTDLWTVNN